MIWADRTGTWCGLLFLYSICFNMWSVVFWDAFLIAMVVNSDSFRCHSFPINSKQSDHSLVTAHINKAFPLLMSLLFGFVSHTILYYSYTFVQENPWRSAASEVLTQPCQHQYPCHSQSHSHHITSHHIITSHHAIILIFEHWHSRLVSAWFYELLCFHVIGLNE